MDPTIVDTTVKAYMTEMRSRLEKATSIARAAEACALSDNVDGGIEIVLGIEQITYEVNTFLNAASLIQARQKLGASDCPVSFPASALAYAGRSRGGVLLSTSEEIQSDQK